MFYFWLCVMEHRKKNIEDENLDPSWSVRYDNMEGGLVIGWFAPKKLKRGVRPRHLTSFQNFRGQRHMEFTIINSEVYFPIDKILAHNDSTGIDFFLVKWLTKHPPTWEILEDLEAHGSNALMEFLLRESVSMATSTGLNRIVSGISGSTFYPERRLGRSKTLERNLRLFSRSGNDGIKSSTASSAESKLETTHPKTTLSASTSTSHSYSIPQTPVELWSTASDSPERWLGPGLANLDHTTYPSEILSPPSPDGAIITRKRRQKLAKTILPLNLERRLANMGTNSSRREDAEK